MKKVVSQIGVPFSFYNWHFYPNAPKKVSFLSQPHPHEFRCFVWLEVEHTNRDVEFLLLRDFIQSHVVREFECEKTTASCEMYCDKIADILSKAYPNRGLVVEVSEDGVFKARGVYSG